MMTKWKSLFLTKSILGRTIDLDNSDEVVLRCVRLAYKDMLDGGRYYITNDMDGRCTEFIDILKFYDYRFSRELISKTCNLFGEEEIIGDGNKYVSRYGLSQKFVNMTLKYLYIFSDYTNLKIDFSNCDCPLDSVILGYFPEVKNKWSKLTPAEYEKCQGKITEELNKRKLDSELQTLGNLAFDFLEW